MVRRYDRSFHYKERLEQWCCREPGVPLGTYYEIEQEALKMFPDLSTLYRSDVFFVLRKLRLTRYKENWKSILSKITGRDPRIPSETLVERCKQRFGVISDRLKMVTDRDVYFPGKPVISGARGRSRKNMLHLNYIHRKILESFGDFSWRREFPLLKTSSKIHDLDNAAEKIFHTLGLPFVRTAVVQVPKCRMKLRNIKRN